MKAQTKRTKSQTVSFPSELHRKITQKTVNKVGGFSRYVVQAVEEKIQRERSGYNRTQQKKEICVQ